jgi:hypothetical protein
MPEISIVICGLKASRKITIPFRGLRRQTHPPSHPPYAGDETGARTSNTRTRNAAARGATEPLPRTSRRPCAFSNVPRGSRICGHTFGFTQWSWIHHASRSHCYDFRAARLACGAPSTSVRTAIALPRGLQHRHACGCVRIQAVVWVRAQRRLQVSPSHLAARRVGRQPKVLKDAGAATADSCM